MKLAETLAWLVDIPSETGDEGRIATAIAERLLPTMGAGVERLGNSLVVGHRGGRPLIRCTGTPTPSLHKARLRHRLWMDASSASGPRI